MKTIHDQEDDSETMKNNEELFQILMERAASQKYIHPEDIPGIELYMDQVTTFMEQRLENAKRHGDDKVLTKTMINNYAKNDLLPPPVKKKYSREHMLMLIFIYYYKNLLSIGDIQTLMQPLCDRYFNAADGLNLTDIYTEVFSMARPEKELLYAEAKAALEKASHTFAGANVSDEEREELQRFAFISLLSFDVYMKKQMIEFLIDEMAAEKATEEAVKKSQKKKEK